MNRFSNYRRSGAIAFATVLLSVGCAKEATPPEQGAVKNADAAPAVTPTGRIVTIEAYSDGAGNYFKPNQVEAHRGDVVRFVLKSGVHNINFLPDSNPGAKFLPSASDMLQLPDQTYDVLVAMEHGSYYFQCDPHAALGMIGHIKVEN